MQSYVFTAGAERNHLIYEFDQKVIYSISVSAFRYKLVLELDQCHDDYSHFIVSESEFRSEHDATPPSVYI